MNDEVKTFGATAKSLARNPLGIIALFIVLVYGFASLVTAFAGSFTSAERLPLIYFLIGFPVLVLGVFSWLEEERKVSGTVSHIYVEPMAEPDGQHAPQSLVAQRVGVWIGCPWLIAGKSPWAFAAEQILSRRHRVTEMPENEIRAVKVSGMCQEPFQLRIPSCAS